MWPSSVLQFYETGLWSFFYSVGKQELLSRCQMDVNLRLLSYEAQVGYEMLSSWEVGSVSWLMIGFWLNVILKIILLNEGL